MENRIRQLRNALGLTRKAFGEKLGVSADVINNIERERNRTPLSDVFIKHLCFTFHVNEQWLRTGTGGMFTPTLESSAAINSPALNELQQEFNLTDDDITLLSAYISLAPEERQAIIKLFSTISNK